MHKHINHSRTKPMRTSSFWTDTAVAMAPHKAL